MNKNNLKIKCFIHKQNIIKVYTTCFKTTTTALSTLKIGSLVQLSIVEFVVFSLSFELMFMNDNI
jgi:hypothetical protein